MRESAVDVKRIEPASQRFDGHPSVLVISQQDDWARGYRKFGILNGPTGVIIQNESVLKRFAGRGKFDELHIGPSENKVVEKSSRNPDGKPDCPGLYDSFN